MFVPGVRLALWLGGAVVIVTGAIASKDVHYARQEARAADGEDS